MKTLLCLLLLVLVPTATAQQDIVDMFESRTQTFEGFTLPYRLFVPADYDATQAYPLVLALHGAGERGTNNVSQITPHRLATSWADPVNQAEYPTFVVAPQVPPNRRWSAEQPAAQSDFTDVQLTTLAILDALEAEFNIDPNRLYITGLSMGGHGTWDFIARLPGKFAAAVPMSGLTYPQNAPAIMDMPIWAFHGESDTVVPASGSRRIIQEMEDRGRNVLYTHCRRSPPLATNYDCPGAIPLDSLAEAIEDHVDLIFTSEPNVGHGPWSPWYDHPLLFDWVFSKYRLALDAIALDAPAGGAVWSGEQTIPWTSTQTATDVVEVWLSLDDGGTWAQVGEAAVGDGAFTLDTSAYPDSPLAQVRLFVVNAEGFVYGRTTSETFTFDNDGNAPPYLAIDDEALRFDPIVTEETLTLSVLAADPESSSLTADVYYSLNGGDTFAQAASVTLTSSPEPQEISVDLVPLPNSPDARLRITLSDGTHTVSDTTAHFVKETPRYTNSFVEHVEGEGVGTVTMHFVDPASLTGHRYRITIDASDPEAKTYSVTDLTLGTPVLTDVPFSDGVLESPLFDGMTLVVEDLEEGMPDLEATGWIEGDTDLDVAISGGTVRIAVLTVELLATEDDYELTITEDVAGTSLPGYGIGAEDLYFTVTSQTDGLVRDVIFDDENGDGRPGDGDILYLMEENTEGVLKPAWRFTFSTSEGTVLPEAGDTFLFVPLRSLSSEDVFEFVADINVDAASGPDDAGLPLLASYPNPFVRQATIAYRIPEPATVTLEVFDVLGRRVAVLEDGSLEAGTYEVAWNGDETMRGRLANGVFFVRLTTRPLRGGPSRTLQRALTRIR